MPIKHTADGKVDVVSKPRPTAEFNGRKYVLEESITGDFALIKAYKADEKGNLVFHLTARLLHLLPIFIEKIMIHASIFSRIQFSFMSSYSFHLIEVEISQFQWQKLPE